MSRLAQFFPKTSSKKSLCVCVKRASTRSKDTDIRYAVADRLLHFTHRHDYLRIFFFLCVKRKLKQGMMKEAKKREKVDLKYNKKVVIIRMPVSEQKKKFIHKQFSFFIPAVYLAREITERTLYIFFIIFFCLFVRYFFLFLIFFLSTLFSMAQ